MAGRSRFGGRGFTLIELLMVMLIIGIVIAIVVPALGGARNAARSAATQRLLTDYVTASSAFRNDNQDRAPGFFSVREMGSLDNEALGFSAMENAMLDLAGGLVEGGGLGGGGAANIIEIEINGRRAYIDPERVGTGKYFEVDKDLFESQPDYSQIGSGEHIGAIPDLVDAWGNPVLLWTNDEFGPRKIEEAEDFARVNSGAGNDPDMGSHFYWASNACFLKSQRLGAGGKDQTFQTLGGDSAIGSIIGDGATSIPYSLAGLLGNPSYPVKRDGVDAKDMLPAQGRGSFVVHSAGTDGVFLSARDPRGRSVIAEPGGATSFALLYGLNFKTGQDSTVDLISDSGQIQTEDVVKKFDDLVQSGGG